MTQPNKPKSTGALNTLRNCLDEEQWQAALHIAKSQSVTHTPGQDQRDPDQPRHQAVRRCLLRVGRGDSPPGIYIVRSRDISAGGIRIIHGGPIKPRSICAVIIESAKNHSTVAGGVVAWCRPINHTDPQAYEIGIGFHQPIDTAPFAGNDQEAA